MQGVGIGWVQRKRMVGDVVGTKDRQDGIGGPEDRGIKHELRCDQQHMPRRER